MLQRHRLKPSRSTSFLGMIVGIFFIFMGITQFMQDGLFGVVWTLIAVAITIINAINVFSKKGISLYHVDTQSNLTATDETENKTYEENLRQLHRLREDGIISDEEYEKKKSEILTEKW